MIDSRNHPSVHNVKAEVKNNTLTITCDVAPATLRDAPSSRSGKTRVVASTHGFIRVDGVCDISLNVTTR